MKNALNKLPFRELLWAIPFVFLALLAAALTRPVATVETAKTGRKIADANGDIVLIPEPFPGVATGNWNLGVYLTRTHAPEHLVWAGDGREREGFKNSLLFEIYPQIYENENLWDSPGTLEAILANDKGGVRLGGHSILGKLGFVEVPTYPKWEGFDLRTAEWVDHAIFTGTRVKNAVIGKRAQAEVFIGRYLAAYEDLAAELRQETFTERPRILGVVSPSENWSRLTAWGNFYERLDIPDITRERLAVGREQDAERILAMNPELIILYVGSREGFMRDPRWRGLIAVKENRVYEQAIEIMGHGMNLDTQPTGARWVAELAFPGRLKPRLREILRAYYEEAYAYRLSEELLDRLLRIEQNADAADYGRFMRKVDDGTKKEAGK